MSGHDSEKSALFACSQCDALQRVVYGRSGTGAKCWRCEAPIWDPHALAPDVSLALVLAAAVLFAIANSYPLIVLDAKGNQNATTLIGATFALWNQDMGAVGTLVLVTTVVVPAIELAAMIYLLVGVRLWEHGKLGGPPARAAVVLRILQAVKPWAMLEVFLLGALVSFVKLGHLAKVEAGASLWALALLILLFTFLTHSFDTDAMWRRLPVNGPQT